MNSTSPRANTESKVGSGLPGNMGDKHLSDSGIENPASSEEGVIFEPNLGELYHWGTVQSFTEEKKNVF